MKKKYFGSFPPLSLILFAGIILIYISQFIPFIGTLWSILNPIPYGLSPLLINAAFLLVFIDILSGSLSKWFSLVPLLFFTTYFSFVHTNNQVILDARNEVLESNAKIKIPFDSHKNAIVISTEHSRADGGFQQGLINSLLVDYGVPVVYVPNKLYPPYYYLSSRLTKNDDCDYKKRKQSNTIKYSMRLTGLSFDYLQGKDEDLTFCIVRYPENPTGEVTTIQITDEPQKKKTTPKTKVHGNYIIFKNEDTEQRVQNAFIKLWPWIPRFIAECNTRVYHDIFVGMFTLFIPPKVQKSCVFGFQRNYEKLFLEGKNEHEAGDLIVSNALGLKTLPDRNQLEELIKQVDIKAIENKLIAPKLPEIEEKRRLAIERFQKFLDNPTSSGIVIPRSFPQVQRLKEDPSFATEISLKMFRALDSVNNIRPFNGRRYKKERKLLSETISKIPKEQFIEISPLLLEMLRSAKGDTNYREFLVQNSSIVIRLGDAGEPANAFLLELLRMYYKDQFRSVPKAVLLGICRAGDDIADRAMPMLLEVARHTNLSAVSGIELAVALMRLGKELPYLEINYWNERRLRPDGEIVSRISPPSVCVNQNGYPVFSD